MAQIDGQTPSKLIKSVVQKLTNHAFLPAYKHRPHAGWTEVLDTTIDRPSACPQVIYVAKLPIHIPS